MSSRKRTRTSENQNANPTGNHLVFVDYNAPKKPRLSAKKAREFTSADIQNLREQREAERAEKEKETAIRKEAEANALRKTRLDAVWESICQQGYGTLAEYLKDLLDTNDSVRSSQISLTLTNHGQQILNSIAKRHEPLAHDWALSSIRQVIDKETEKLAQCFRQDRGSTVAETLENFSVSHILTTATTVAPSLCDVLQQAGQGNSRRERRPMMSTIISMLAKSRNEHATQYHAPMGIYLLASGASRSLFDVLNHAGVTLSYTHTVSKLKDLGAETLDEIRKLVRSRAFMLIWDNLNIAFKVSEQRADSKNHFDNGTTATLVPLFDVEYGELSLDLLPPRTSRLPLIKFGPEDLLPTHEEAERVQAGQLWHIEDILYQQYPGLKKRFGNAVPACPTVHRIPLHQTKQYPLPAMHIDESTLEGTLDVLKSILFTTLKLSEDELRQHGVILCAGDQLTLSLLDKISASRRDDQYLPDNISRFTYGQNGLLHIKFAAARLVTNEHWGKPNGRAPWSLWKINTLLGRKNIGAGWKTKKPAPFRQTWELMLELTLPANILDAFRLFCGKSSLDEWIKTVRSPVAVHLVAEKILHSLCSARRVQKLRELPSEERDVSLENVILFNRDCLFLRQFRRAIKFGDVGAVLDIITHWMLAFRGCGKMPKYADALFHLLVSLKRANPKIRNAFLMNWLANLTGREDGFKEMDLLQEHQNFWAKVIYNARGSNRSWEWLAMVSVSIFALRDVIRQVQREFQTPHNGTSHTSPSTQTDIAFICEYLEAQRIQEYVPQREGNSDATAVCDLLATGAEYANSTSAFKIFRRPKVKVVNPRGPRRPVQDMPIESESESEEEDKTSTPVFDLGHNGSDSLLDVEDFSLDEEEYPAGTDVGSVVAATLDIINELRHFG